MGHWNLKFSKGLPNRVIPHLREAGVGVKVLGFPDRTPTRQGAGTHGLQEWLGLGMIFLLGCDLDCPNHRANSEGSGCGCGPVSGGGEVGGSSGHLGSSHCGESGCFAGRPIPRLKTSEPWWA
jgi:hypothetical protein